MIKRRSLLEKIGGKSTTVNPAASVNTMLDRESVYVAPQTVAPKKLTKKIREDRTSDPSFKNTESFGVVQPSINKLSEVTNITRDKGTPSIRESVQRENATQNSIAAKIEKQTRSDSKEKAKTLKSEMSAKYGIDVDRANSPIEAVNMLSMVDDSQKEQFKKDFAEYSFAAERSNPFRAGAEAGFNVLPTNLEKTEGKEDVQTAKGYGAGRLVGGIGQQLAFNSVLGAPIESLTSKLLPKATPFVAETIKDVAIGTGTQLAEAPFDKPTAGQFGANIALDIALNALFGVVGKGLSKVDLSNLKTAKPSQVVGDVAEKLNVSIVEADKTIDDAIDFYVNQSGVADTKPFEQLQLPPPSKLSEKVRSVNVEPQFRTERPNVLTQADLPVKPIEPTLNVASKVDQPTTTMKIEPTLKQRADNVASKFENQFLETGDNVLTSGEIKERGFSENIRTDANRVDEVRKELDTNPEFYEVLGNKDTLASAQARFDRGYDEALQDFERTKSTLRADNVPFAKLLADEAAKRGDMNTARRIIVDVAENLTTAGQYSQAAKILRESNDPITVLRFVQKELDKLNKTGSTRYGKKWNKIDLTDAELDTINKLGKDATDEQKEQLFESLFESVSTRIPTTNREKFDAWRRIAMLFNPKTHVRNTLGNALMTGVKKVSDKVAQGLELTLPKEIRTKGNVTKELKSVSNDYFKKNKKQLMEGSRWEIFGVKSPFADKPIFKTGWLNTLDDVSKRTLEAEDIMFFKKNFTDDLASFMNTRGLKEPTQEAIDYATRRAQEATFRQANKLAEAINKMKGSRYGLLVDAAIPFTKTPANILATGLDYSPIGAIKGAITLINNADPAKAIETLSKGLTGTSLSLLGYYMGMNGLARGEYEKSAKVEGLYQATGQLPNSIKTGKGSYTIDWAQPLSMPFFMGVAFAESLKKQSDDKAQAVFDALVAGGETLVKQSMLQGISDLFGGYGSTTEKIIQLPINYMTQGFPTVFGQIARVIDPSKRQADYTTIASKTITPLISRTPIASTTLSEKFGILGEPQKYGKGLLNAFQQFLSPGFIGQPSENPLAQEIDRLYKEVGSDFLPRYNVSSFQNLGEQYKLSGTERSELQRIMGEYTAEQLSKMVETYVYRSASDEQKSEMIKKANETGYKLAKESIVKARDGK